MNDETKIKSSSKKKGRSSANDPPIKDTKLVTINAQAPKKGNIQKPNRSHADCYNDHQNVH